MNSLLWLLAHINILRSESLTIKSRQLRCKSNVAGALRKPLTSPSRTERNDRDSPLLRLPGELRNHIYEKVFTVINPLCFSRTTRPFKKFHRSVPFDLSLLYVCRKIYHDTALLPFSLNTIQCNSFVVLEQLWSRLSVEQRQAVKLFRMATHFEYHSTRLSAPITRRNKAPKSASLSNIFPALRKVTLELASRPCDIPIWSSVDQRTHDEKVRAFMNSLERWVQGPNGEKMDVTWNGMWF